MVLEQWLGPLGGFLETPVFRGVSLFDIVEAALILAVGLLVLRAVLRGIARAMARARFPPLQQEVFLRTVRALLAIALLGVALTPLHIDLTSLVVGFGVLGVVAGFAFQAALSNIAAGVLIAASRPFDQGHRVLIANTEGTVEHLGMIATALRTPDNRRVHVPNALVLANPIVNYDAFPSRRVDVTLEVPLGRDLDAVLRALERAAASLPTAGDPRPPEVLLKGLGEKGVAVEVRAWAPREDWEAARAALVAAAGAALAGKPFPPKG